MTSKKVIVDVNTPTETDIEWIFDQIKKKLSVQESGTESYWLIIEKVEKGAK